MVYRGRGAGVMISRRRRRRSPRHAAYPCRPDGSFGFCIRKDLGPREDHQARDRRGSQGGEEDVVEAHGVLAFFLSLACELNFEATDQVNDCSFGRGRWSEQRKRGFALFLRRRKRLTIKVTDQIMRFFLLR